MGGTMLLKRCVIALGASGALMLGSMAGCSDNKGTDGGLEASDDTGTKDSGKDTGKDTGTQDTGVTPMCPEPEDVSAYTPAAFIPPNKLTVCSDNQITGYFDNCYGAHATQMTCSAI